MSIEPLPEPQDPDAIAKETAAHLMDCAVCRSVVQESRAVGTALRNLSAPPPPAWAERIVQVEKPRWHAVAAMFVAGILIGGTATYVGQSDVSFAGFVPNDHAVLSTSPHPIGPGRWTYLRRSYVDSVLWANPMLETVTVEPSATDWIIVTTSPRGDRDSLRVRRRDLMPLSGTWAPPTANIRGAQQFTRDSVVSSAWTSTRTRRVAYAIADSSHARIADETMLRLYFRTVALDRHWHRTVRLLSYRVEGPETVDLNVIGHRAIESPVGRCDCWQVATSIHGIHSVIWVRSEDGVVVKTEDAYGVAELVAEDPLPT